MIGRLEVDKERMEEIARFLMGKLNRCAVCKTEFQLGDKSAVFAFTMPAQMIVMDSGLWIGLLVCPGCMKDSFNEDVVKVAEFIRLQVITKHVQNRRN